MKIFFSLLILTVFAAAAYAQTIRPIKLAPHRTGFIFPVGIDHHHPTNKVVVSVNFPTGQPHNFELVDSLGNRQPFSGMRGLMEEVKIATARDDGGGMSRGGFLAGELFTGTGVAGHIARISADGANIQNPWVALPGETGLLRGSLHVDRTGIFGGDLIVVTTEPAGNVWRVTSAGVSTRLASLGTHLEGLTTVPNDAVQYGPWAGKILAGAEQQSRIYTIDAQGNTAFFSLGIDPEDFDIIPANENFFGVDLSAGTLWAAPAAQFTDKVGDILITQEFPAHLYHVRWTGTRFQATSVAQQATQWEHVTFSTLPVRSIACEVEITAPEDSAFICENRVQVTATTTISGGIPPLTAACEINGIPAMVSGNMFSATVSLRSGWNDLIAACTVTDNSGNEAVCRDTMRVFSKLDKTPPTCTINPGYKSVTGTIADEESGIAKIEALFIFNARLTVDSFTPGDKQVNYRLNIIDSTSYIGFDLKITDRCGNMHICDPVLFQLEADQKDRPYTVTFRSVDRYLILTNHGLTKIFIDLNGRQFSLVSRPDSVAQNRNAYHLPLDGAVTIDLQKYLRDNENHIRFEFEGPAGAGAEVMLIDEAHGIDHALELLPLPTAYQLSQNYPNPFNPATTIHFSIPAHAANGTRVQFRLYNTLGELVRTLVDEKMFPGHYAVTWDGRNRHGYAVSSGIYFFQLVAAEFKQTKRLMVLR